jgi:hypothetical protein
MVLVAAGQAAVAGLVVLALVWWDSHEADDWPVETVTIVSNEKAPDGGRCGRYLANEYYLTTYRSENPPPGLAPVFSVVRCGKSVVGASMPAVRAFNEDGSFDVVLNPPQDRNDYVEGPLTVFVGLFVISLGAAGIRSALRSSQRRSTQASS